MKIDRTTYKDWQQKHKSIEKKLAKSISTKLGPSTYEPIVADTFASRAADKSRVIINIFSLYLDGVMEQLKSAKV